VLVTLIVVGFLGGLVAGISPCIIPVLPVIFAAGAAVGLDEPHPQANAPSGERGRPMAATDGTAVAGTATTAGTAGTAAASPAWRGTGDEPGPATAVIEHPGQAAIATAARPARSRRRPVVVVAGLVLSFSIFTLVGSWLLSLLGLPQDALRWIGLTVLGLVGLGLVVPPIGEALERPFLALAPGRQHTEAGGFVLGLSLGLVFVPCAGPVLAAITVVSANHRIGLSAVVLTAAFAVGVAVPLLFFALLGQRLAGRMHLIRSRAAVARRVIGVVLIGTALVIGLNLTNGLQRAVPGYTDTLQSHIETGGSAKQALAGVTGESTTGALASCTDASPVLQQCGNAPPLSGISQWLNTPGGSALTISGLRGRVVLVDFWTYSCINCQRTLPHLEAWNRSYAKDGLTIIGVHTPEFAFEHVVSNVTQAATQLGVHYPIAIDNNYVTWNAYENQYWPAEYLIDATGHVRHVDFGEGQYSQTESFIRHLLVVADPRVMLPAATDVPNTTPTEPTTPESYLGYQHPENLAGQTIQQDEMSTYQAPPTVPQDEYAYNGRWSIGNQSSTAGPGAMVLLNFEAKDVYLVLGGSGSVAVSVDGRLTRTVAVTGEPKLYQLVGGSSPQRALLTLAVSPGVQAYDFTFG
jgi:cytochrome c biogenesis protein CcdA/thiol-disulfide isomerase/thioredoxin